MSLSNAMSFSQALNISLDWLLLGRGRMELDRGTRDDNPALPGMDIESLVAAYQALKNPKARRALIDFLQAL